MDLIQQDVTAYPYYDRNDYRPQRHFRPKFTVFQYQVKYEEYQAQFYDP
jgi:hypothetical protein